MAIVQLNPVSIHTVVLSITTVYIVRMMFQVHSFIGTILCLIVQMGALIWYVVSTISHRIPHMRNVKGMPQIV